MGQDSGRGRTHRIEVFFTEVGFGGIGHGDEGGAHHDDILDDEQAGEI